MKLKLKLQRLQKAVPKRSVNGQLYRTAAQTRKKYSRVTLYTLFVSDENTLLFRDHVFKKDVAITPKAWSEFFERKLREIHRTAVLPGLELRTNKQWAVKRILGWVGDAQYTTDTAALGRERDKTKRQRGARGQDRIRGRHRNARRRAA